MRPVQFGEVYKVKYSPTKPAKSVEEELEHKIYAEAELAEVLDNCGIEAFFEDSPMTLLSGGEQRTGDVFLITQGPRIDSCAEYHAAILAAHDDEELDGVGKPAERIEQGENPDLVYQERWLRVCGQLFNSNLLDEVEPELIELVYDDSPKGFNLLNMADLITFFTRLFDDFKED